MHTLIVLILILQTTVTPLAGGGNLVLSASEPQFPDLPVDGQPTPINENLELLYLFLVPSLTRYHIRGEVRNISTSPLTGVTLVFRLANGMQFDGPTDIEYIPAGGRAPFSVSVNSDDLIAGLNQSQDVTVTGTCGFESVAPIQQHTWQFQDVEIEYDASRRAVRVSGNVWNTGGMPPEWSAPVLFGFSEEGKYGGSIYPVGATQQFTHAGTGILFDIDRIFDTYSSGE